VYERDSKTWGATLGIAKDISLTLDSRMLKFAGIAIGAFSHLKESADDHSGAAQNIVGARDQW